MMMGRVFGSLIFGAAALICLGFAVAMAYETIAVATGLKPTISDIVAGTVLDHPVWAYVWVGAAFFLFGLLLDHFTGWSAGAPK
jgi:hypothetical protein